MRLKRVEKFKRSRHKKTRYLLLFAVILPCFCIIIGYIISTVAIVPSIGK